MSILNEISKIKANISTDISLELIINSLNLSYFNAKVVETLAEKGAAGHRLTESESILNAIFYLIADLEENHSHEKDQWLHSDIMQYIQNLPGKTIDQ